MSKQTECFHLTGGYLLLLYIYLFWTNLSSAKFALAMDGGTVPDSHEPLRTIFRIIIVVVTLVCAAAGVALLVLIANNPKAMIWRISSFVIALSKEENYDVLAAEGIAATSNTIVYSSVGFTAVIMLLSLGGLVGAATHKRMVLIVYSIAMGVITASMVTVVILLVANIDLAKEKLHTFGNISLERGFTGKADSIDDKKPGAVATYMWQWMQVKNKCCGWQSGEDYERVVQWNKTTMVYNVSQFDPVRANRMLTLDNRVALITNTGDNKLELIALEQILPPSCCVLVSTGNKNEDVRLTPLPKHFKNLIIEDFTCTHTGEGSFADKGCYNAFLAMFNKNVYALVGGSIAATFMLAATIFFAHQLAQYPTRAEEKEEANENQANTISDPLGFDQTAPPNQFWDLTAPQPQDQTHVNIITSLDSGSTHSRRSRRKHKSRSKRKKKWPFGFRK